MVTSLSITDTEFAWLRAAGFTGSLSDMRYAYLKTQTKTFVLGTISDLRNAVGLKETIPNPATRTAINLATVNKDFAVNTTGWLPEGTGVSIARVADAQFPGGFCAEVTNANPATAAYIVAGAACYIPAEPGKMYTLSIYVKWVTGTLKQCILSVYFRNATAGTIGGKTAAPVNVITTNVTRVVVGDALAPFGTKNSAVKCSFTCDAGDQYRVGGFMTEIGNYDPPGAYS